MARSFAFLCMNKKNGEVKVFAGCKREEGSVDGKVQDWRFRQPMDICTESESVCRDIALHGHATGPMNIFIFRRLRRQRIHTWRQSSSHNKQPFWVHRIVTASFTSLMPRQITSRSAQKWLMDTRSFVCLFFVSARRYPPCGDWNK